MTRKLASIAAGAVLAFGPVLASAQELTPLGALKGANGDGSIPAWTGGITEAPAGYKPGDHHPDPFPEDKPEFTITGENADKYADKLTPGQLAMLKAYPSFKLPVYKTRRTASYPQRVYDATLANEATAKLVDGGNGVADAIIGIPFRKPTEGLHVIWNHILRYRGEKAKRQIAQAAPTRGGDYTLVKFEDEFEFRYSLPEAKFEELKNVIIYFKQKVTAPARLAGYILLVHETMNQVKEPRTAWTYNTGQRRVRRAPNVAYDNPGTAADGQRTSDNFDMFNGAPDRYDWKLVGRKEVYVPYNSYKLHQKGLPYADLLKPLHLNPDLTRYELHRVWVVDATLKEGTSHVYKRRTFYVDEDSWQILLVDQYDNRDQLWRLSEGHVINYYDKQTLWTTLEVHYDLQNGRYLAIGLDNNEPMYDFTIQRSEADYMPAALRQEGTR